MAQNVEDKKYIFMVLKLYCNHPKYPIVLSSFLRNATLLLDECLKPDFKINIRVFKLEQKNKLIQNLLRASLKTRRAT